MDTQQTEQVVIDESVFKSISLEQAKNFLDLRKKASSLIALGVFLCIVSPTPLIIISGLIDANKMPDYSIFIGLAMLLIIVAIAVVLFVCCGLSNTEYAFLNSEPFNAEIGVTGHTSNEKSKFSRKYITFILAGIMLCIISPLPMIFVMSTTNSLVLLTSLVATVYIIAAAVALLVFAGVRYASMQKLLKQGDYTDVAKKIKKKKDTILNVYWIAVTAIYLVWSFASGSWGFTWIVWPVAGVLSVIISIVCNQVLIPKEK